MYFALASTIVIAVPLLFYFGRCNSLKCHATSILFAASLTLAGAIPLNATLLLFFEPLPFFQPAQSQDCRTAIFQEVGAIPRLPHHDFSRGWHYSPFAALQFFKRPARSPDCSTAIFLVTVMIFRLPCCDFSFGQHNPLIAI
jgi:hypothetical protein